MAPATKVYAQSFENGFIAAFVQITNIAKPSCTYWEICYSI